MDRVVANLDLAPTLLALAGIEPPGFMQGRSLLPLLHDPEAPWRDALLYTYFFEPPYPTPESHALVGERFKLIAYGDGTRELFDLVADSEELTNRAGDPSLAAVEGGLETRLTELQSQMR